MYFSIIIPTRNRYNELSTCLSHILLQSFTDYEVLIVDDGSDSNIFSQYPNIIPSDNRFKLFNQGGATNNGAGASITRNDGLSYAQGQYITFCDDDDFWTDNNHLLIAFNTLSNCNVDMYIANQISVSPNGETKYNDWFPHLSKNTNKYKNISQKNETYLLNIEQLLEEPEIPQLNTLIIKKNICTKINGFWRELTCLEDRDFYLRALEYCNDICFRKKTVSQHNSPASAERKSISNSVSEQEKNVIMVMVLNHVLLNTTRKEILYYCERFLGEVYRDLALATNEQTQSIFAKIALTISFTLKWFLFTNYLKIKLLANFKKT